MSAKTQPKAKALQSLIAFLATTAGRDKSCRVLQYSSRFLKAAFIALSKKQNNELYALIADRIETVGGNMGMTRKVLRWGRPIGILRNVFIQLKSLSKKDRSSSFWQTYFRILSDVSLALFFLFDHVLYLGRMKIVENQDKLSRADYLSNLFWLFECLFTIIADCLQIHELQTGLAQESISRQKSAEEINEIKQKIDGSILNIIRSIIDTPIALHFINPKFLDPAFVGVLGTATSLIGCYQAWPKN